MRLGNSKGNNTGKKYFKRGKHDQHEPIPEHIYKANEFNKWFSMNYQEIANFLKTKSIYNEDVFNTTFMRISEKLLFAGPIIKDYKAYFHRSYFTNYILEKEKEKRYIPLPLYENKNEVHHINPMEYENNCQQLEKDILEYVHNNYKSNEFEIFRVYTTSESKINYQQLSEISHTKTHSIQRIISKIIKDLRSNKEFINRYREIR